MDTEQTSQVDKKNWLNYRLANGGRKCAEQMEAEGRELQQKYKDRNRTALRDRWRNSDLDYQRKAVELADKGYGWQDVRTIMGGVVTAEEARTLVLGG